MIIISEKYVVKPEHREAFDNIRQEFATKVERDGVKLVSTYAVDDPTIFYSWIEHRTPEIAIEIFQSGIVQEMMSKVGSFLAETPHIRRLHISNVETVMEP